MRAAFPDAPIESSDYWQDLEKLERTVVFERAVIVNRAAAHRQYVPVYLVECKLKNLFPTVALGVSGSK